MPPDPGAMGAIGIAMLAAEALKPPEDAAGRREADAPLDLRASAARAARR